MDGEKVATKLMMMMITMPLSSWVSKTKEGTARGKSIIRTITLISRGDPKPAAEVTSKTTTKEEMVLITATTITTRSMIPEDISRLMVGSINKGSNNGIDQKKGFLLKPIDIGQLLDRN